MTKSVYLDDFGKATNAPDFLIRAMRERKIIPRDVPNDAVMLTIYGAGSWRVSWTKDNVIYTYNPWTALITDMRKPRLSKKTKHQLAVYGYAKTGKMYYEMKEILDNENKLYVMVERTNLKTGETDIFEEEDLAK